MFEKRHRNLLGHVKDVQKCTNIHSDFASMFPARYKVNLCCQNSNKPHFIAGQTKPSIVCFLRADDSSLPLQVSPTSCWSPLCSTANVFLCPQHLPPPPSRLKTAQCVGIQPPSAGRLPHQQQSPSPWNTADSTRQKERVSGQCHSCKMLVDRIRQTLMSTPQTTGLTQEIILSSAMQERNKLLHAEDLRGWVQICEISLKDIKILPFHSA